MNTADIINHIIYLLHDAYCGRHCRPDCHFDEERDFLVDKVFSGDCEYVANWYFGGDGILLYDLQDMYDSYHALLSHEKVAA